MLYSASGNAWPAPQLITISFMPDGTNFGGKTTNLQSTFNAKFGSAATWQNIILKAAQTWAAQTNINFAVVSDNGTADGSGNNQQGDPGFGDIRIGGYNFGTTTLAQAFLPPPVNNYSVAGDIAFNTGQTFNNGSTYDLFTVAVHEIGHALGLYHSGVASAEMYSTYNGVKSALTSDDVAGIESIYSAGQPRAKDPYFNTTSSTPSFSTAYDITSQINTTTLTAQVTDGTISQVGGSDLFSFTVPAGAAGQTLKVSVQSKGLSLLTPAFMVYNASGNQIASAQGVAYGDTITSTWSGLVAGSKMYVKVFSPVTTAFGTGAYALTLNLGPNASPAVPLPDTTLPNGIPLTSGGGQAVAVSYEAQVNTYTAGATTTTPDQQAVAMDKLGNYVVVWAAQNEDGSGWGVYGQRFNANGTKAGGEFRVNTTTAGDQTNPSVAMDAVGDFVVTWQSHNQDGSGWGVYAQQYAALGVPLGGEFRVNTYTQNDQTNPSVAMDAVGNFVIAYQSSGQDGNGLGVFARQYDLLGIPLGAEFQVNTYTTSDQSNPMVAMNATGGYAITWQSNGQDGNGWGVYAQRYGPSGAKVGNEFRVNTTTSGNQQNPEVAIDDAGDLLVTWTTNVATTWTIAEQQYTPAGVPLGGEFSVNTTQGTVTNPSIEMNDQGNVVAAWTRSGAGVFTQQFTISFSQEASDGFYAQGDPNDPDQAHTTPPSHPAGPPTPPVVVVPHGHDAPVLGPPFPTGGPVATPAPPSRRPSPFGLDLHLGQGAGSTHLTLGSAPGGLRAPNLVLVDGRLVPRGEALHPVRPGQVHPSGLTAQMLRVGVHR